MNAITHTTEKQAARAAMPFSLAAVFAPKFGNGTNASGFDGLNMNPLNQKTSKENGQGQEKYSPCSLKEAPIPG